MIGKNNPFNIRYSPLNKWKGLCGSTRGFCDFKDEYFGVRAAMYLLMRSYKKKNIETIKEMIERFAPPSENKTADYVAYICYNTHMLPFDIPKTDFDWVSLFHYISAYEGNPIDAYMLGKYYYKFKSEG